VSRSTSASSGPDDEWSQRTVILAAGNFPRRGTLARRVLESATRVVCCDSAADAYRRHLGRIPTVVVGDCDSLRGEFPNVVRIAEQESNDLAKAVRYCRRRGWSRPVVLGAMGRRDDHAIGNLFLAMECGLEIVTDTGRFVPVAPRLTLRMRKDSAVSVFAVPGVRMRSVGLKWPLDGVEFANFHCATLNRAVADEVRLESTGPAYVFVHANHSCQR